MIFNEKMPNCVPEYYRSMFEDAAHREELEYERQQADRQRYAKNQAKIEAAMEVGLPVLDFGGYGPCWECQHADHDTRTGPDDDICTVICNNPACREHQKGDGER